MFDDEFFWEGVKNNQLLFQQCSDCGKLRQPPLPMCPHCQSLRWQARAAQGKGTVYSWIVSKHPSMPEIAPRTVALIELEEGVRLVSNLQDIDEPDIREGMPVEVFFQEINGQVLPQFRPVDGKARGHAR